MEVRLNLMQTLPSQVDRLLLQLLTVVMEFSGSYMANRKHCQKFSITMMQVLLLHPLEPTIHQLCIFQFGFLFPFELLFPSPPHFYGRPVCVTESHLNVRSSEVSFPPLLLPLHLTVLFYFLLQISPTDTLTVWRTVCFSKCAAVQTMPNITGKHPVTFHTEINLVCSVVIQWQLNSLFWKKQQLFPTLGGCKELHRDSSWCSTPAVSAWSTELLSTQGGVC